MDAILAVDELVRPMTDQTLEAALQNPYLLDVLLGLSAQHLAVLYPSQADYYHHQATQLQTRGLSRFNQARDDISGEKSIPMFLFASTLGHQLLCDSLRSCRDDFDSYLGQFAWYLEIHRGVSTVTNCSWKTIRESGVKTFVQFLEAAKPTTEAPEIDTLHCMLDQSNLSPVSLQACRQATETLRNSFHIYRSILKRSIHTSASVTSFGACVTTDFIDVLKQRRPEALVILAFYAVLLHWCRNFWIFSDAGQFMIRSIAARLGDHGSKWLAFPLSVLEMEQTG
ncbi:Upc2 protein [Colletotrichum truncatum]|uniref:Upc2 protein n=1 Tax=Colletotrichum truncatum TaxID=5467 RepID=A0ACC3YYW3_COLTU|nr:Upc2 protein [Colletotrichum truncatum]KAF6781104.1 Upc2 protein [Colletotrichum truncatum]